MKHIVERLKEKRDIEIAKSILESNGYRVSKSTRRVKESTGTRKWSGYRKEPGNPCLVKYYTDDQSELVGVVYQPDGDEYETYGVEIYDNNTATSILQSGWSAPDFETEEEAMQWVEEWFRNEEEWMPESKDDSLQEGTNDILDKYSDVIDFMRGELLNDLASYLRSKSIDDGDIISGVDISLQGDHLLVEVYAELGYRSMEKLAYRLDPIIQSYDKDAYFDMEDTGRMSAWISLSKLDKVD